MPLPPLSADLFLIHPPAFFDFRGCRTVYFPFPGSSGDVPITPLYEYFPLGFKSLQNYLGERGHAVKVINLSSLLVQFPALDFADIIQALDTGLIGIDLHWMVHIQGALAVAEEVKKLRNEVRILFGGISATYYAEELIRYPFIDMVLRGYDTHLPLEKLLQRVKAGRKPDDVPNLLWKHGTEIVQNGYTHKPDTYGYCIDWSIQPHGRENKSIPFAEVISATSAGCRYNCKWCGGSRSAFRRVHGKHNSLVYRSLDYFESEMDTLGRIPAKLPYHVYPVGTYNETEERLDRFLDIIASSRVRSTSYEQFKLPADSLMRKMVRANPRTSITLSPDSHDLRIAKLAGKGAYSNEQLEAWIDRALDIGIYQIDLWYLVGLPEQDEKSVLDTIDYAHHLLAKFEKPRVNPMICPMLPILDPASTLFESPTKYGYRLFYRSAEEHRQGMGRASLVNRTNYETRWLSRKELVRVGYEAIHRLMEAKADTGFLPLSAIRNYNSHLEDAISFMEIVLEVDNIPDRATRAVELEKIGDAIQMRNDELLYSGVLNQAFPINRQIGGRWIDEIGWEPDILASACSRQGEPRNSVSSKFP
jgi:clorobiocin biosynthesis protein CloN6